MNDDTYLRWCEDFGFEPDDVATLIAYFEFLELHAC